VRQGQRRELRQAGSGRRGGPGAGPLRSPRAGRGVAKNPEKAVDYYDLACGLSDGPACEKAARTLQTGAGGNDPDKKLGICQRFDRACNLGVGAVCEMSYRLCGYSGP